MNLTITPAAEKFIQRMIRFSGVGDRAGFRLKVSPGGCSGLSAEFSVEAKAAPGETLAVVNGLSLFLPPESLLLLDGVTIDFADTPTSSGLAFLDPKAKRCDCSTAGLASIDVASIEKGH